MGFRGSAPEGIKINLKGGAWVIRITRTVIMGGAYTVAMKISFNSNWDH